MGTLQPETGEGQMVEAERSRSEVIMGSQHHEGFIIDMRRELHSRMRIQRKDSKTFMHRRVVQPRSPDESEGQLTVLKAAGLGRPRLSTATEKLDPLASNHCYFYFCLRALRLGLSALLG
jgi:hypothetical protein